ncbi:hypothetical protein [Neorhizobium sp. DAR64872/K0K18]|uniref:hypothetical protein n=1 Tax=Neorhizobium sp. DAR64872/K0K18 TaxID=3421958 RepID=UPI0010EAD598|nr:MAG: hypothetical protein EOP06_08395 [Pseudomonadota bacterium]
MEFLIFAALISLPYLLGWAFLAFLSGWRSLSATTIIFFILIRVVADGEGYEKGGVLGGLFAILALFGTGLFAGAVSAALSIIFQKTPTPRVRPIFVRVGCAAVIYPLYATWKPFRELVSGIAIG